MSRTYDDEKIYGIHEVFYDEKGEINGWTQNIVPPRGLTPEEFYENLGVYLEALSYEVLDADRMEKR